MAPIRSTRVSRVFIVLVALMLGSTPSQGQTTGSLDWSAYEAPSHGFRVEVPTALFRADPPPPPSEETGRTFRALGGSATVTVFGAPRRDRSLRELSLAYLEKAGNPRITYTRRFGSSLVMSGFQGDDIFYMKMILPPRDDVINVLEIKYPREMKREFDGVVTRMSHSFRRM